MAGTLNRIAESLVRLPRRIAARSLIPRDGCGWLVVRVGAEMDELRPSSFAWLRRPGLALFDALRTLDAAARDSRLDGVVLRFDGSLPGWSKAVALRREVERLREKGKRVVAWADSLDTQQYWVASAADRVWLPEVGALHLVGLRSEQVYLRRLLEQIDVSPEIVRVGNYKTAGEPFLRDSMSGPQREQLESWQGDLFASLVEGIASGRGLEPDLVIERIDGGPYSAEGAREAGLIDACFYWDEVEDELVPLSPANRSAPRRPQLIDAVAYFALQVADVGRSWLGRVPRIAYVVASGPITRGRGSRGVSSEGFGGLIEEIRGDAAIRAVVLRVDSPGGDAVASDLLHRQLERLAREKPVVVSMGDVAASGGYYLAAAADGVFAEAATLTGSIGVVGGKANLAGLYQRLGIAKDAIESGARAGLLSEARGFTSGERAALTRQMESIYEIFLERVARGRGLSREAVEKVAQGRVWSGLRAHSLGLVDALGGPLEALRDAGRRAGLVDGERFALDFYPRRARFPDLRGLIETVVAILRLG